MKIKEFILAIVIAMVFQPAAYAENGTHIMSKCGEVLDLSHFDFSNDKISYELSDNWQAIEGEIARPVGAMQTVFEACVSVPDEWPSIDIGRSDGVIARADGFWSSAAFGVKTYRLKLKLPELDDALALHIPYQYSAYEIWVDDRLAAQNGVIGLTPKEERTYSKIQIVELPQKKFITLTMIISNHTNHEGGFLSPILLGKHTTLSEDQNFYNHSYVFLFSILLALFIIHTIYFLNGRGKFQTTSHILFSGLVFVLMFRIAITQQLVQVVFHDVEQREYLFLEYLTVYLSPALYIGFLTAVFPKEFSWRINKVIYFCCGLGLVFVIFTPSFVYTKLRDIWILVMMFCTIYGVTCVFLAVYRRRVGAIGIAFTAFLFFLAIVNDGLYRMHYYESVDLGPFGIAVLAIAFSVTLSLKQAIAYKELGKTKDEIVEINLTLEERILVRTKELKDAWLDAEESREEKSRFLAAASHDMRQPIHALALQNHLFKNKLENNPELNNIADKQFGLIESLSHLLSGITELSKLNDGQISAHKEEFAINDLFEDVKTEIQSLAVDKGVELKFVQNNGFVVNDRLLFKRVLVNLISNAINASAHSQKPNKKVLVGCRVKQRKLIVQVLDNGIGIPKDDIKIIFKRFAQASNNPSKDTIKDIHGQNGMGLGLSIVLQLTKLIDVQLHVGSVLGKGTVFSIET